MMVQSNDPIDQAQADLDAEQQGIPSPSAITITQAEYQQIMNKIDALGQQAKSTQGMLHKGLNTMAEKTADMVDQRFKQVRDHENRQSIMQHIPDEERANVEAILNEYAQAQQKAPVNNTPVTDDFNAQALQWRDIVQNTVGVDPDTIPVKTWQILMDSNRNDDQRQRDFMDAAYKHKFAMESGGRRPRAARQPRATQAASNNAQRPTPPVENGSGTRGADTAHDLRSMYLADTIDSENYHARMRAIGEQP
jgi:hypothetical protein